MCIRDRNVVSAAGAPHRFTANGIQQAIREAGFEPKLRDQQYMDREFPKEIIQQADIPDTMQVN